MAAVTAAQIKQVYQYPPGSLSVETIVTAIIGNVNTGDTIDVSSAIGAIPAFSRLKFAPWGPLGDGAGGADSAAILGTLSNGATGTNNKITFTLTSFANGSLVVTMVGTP